MGARLEAPWERASVGYACTSWFHMELRALPGIRKTQVSRGTEGYCLGEYQKPENALWTRVFQVVQNNWRRHIWTFTVKRQNKSTKNPNRNHEDWNPHESHLPKWYLFSVFCVSVWVQQRAFVDLLKLDDSHWRHYVSRWPFLSANPEG